MTDCRPSRMNSYLRWLTTLCAGAMLTACGSNNSAVGSGVKPSYLVLFPASNTKLTSEAEIFECEEAPFKAYLYFTDGSVGDFTDRVVWSSAAPGIAQVSNGDLPVPYSSYYYTSGVVLPAAGGSTTIYADYQGIIGSIRVDVSTPSEITLTDTNYIDLPSTINYNTSNGVLRLGTGTSQVLKVTAKLDGVRKDISTYAYWSFDNGGDPGELSINTYGVLNATKSGAVQTLRAVFPSCDTQLTQQIDVKDIKSLALSPEYDTNASYPMGYVDPVSGALLPLLVGNSEALTTYAQFADDSIQQDVSTQVSYVSSLPDLMSVGGTGVANVVSAQGPTPEAAVIYAQQSFGGQSQLTSNTISISAINGTLESLTTAPPIASLTAGSIDYISFTANGLFIKSDGTTVNQDVTRRVTWSADPATAATTISTGTNAGRVTTTSSAVPSTYVTITATELTAIVNTTANSTLTVK